MKVIKNYLFQILCLELILINTAKTKKCQKYEKVTPRKLEDNTEKAPFLFNLIKIYEISDDIYTSIAKFTNGDIVIEIIKYDEEIRTFFGLKANGKYLFGDENIMSDNSLITIEHSETTGNNILPFIIKDENNKEYMVSIMSSASTTYPYYFDINNLESKNLYRQQLNNILTLESRDGSIIPI